jgi:hypothetical protein
MPSLISEAWKQDARKQYENPDNHHNFNKVKGSSVFEARASVHWAKAMVKLHDQYWLRREMNLPKRSKKFVKDS